MGQSDRQADKGHHCIIPPPYVRVGIVSFDYC